MTSINESLLRLALMVCCMRSSAQSSVDALLSFSEYDESQTEPVPVIQSTVFRLRPGMAQGFMANVATGKKILERLGAKVRVVNQLVGSNAPCTAVIVESLDWKAYGEFSAKRDADSEWLAFIAKIVGNREPEADQIATGLSVDAPIG
jgi:hypothetical protein